MIPPAWAPVEGSDIYKGIKGKMFWRKQTTTKNSQFKYSGQIMQPGTATSSVCST